MDLCGFKKSNFRYDFWQRYPLFVWILDDSKKICPGLNERGEGIDFHAKGNGAATNIR
jgi:hypothetical protein